MRQDIDVLISYMNTMQVGIGSRQLVHDIVLRNLDPHSEANVKKIKEFAKSDPELYEAVLQVGDK